MPILLQQIQSVLETESPSAEIIFINDGSTYTKAEVLDKLAIESPLHVHVIHFRRNRGKADPFVDMSRVRVFSFCPNFAPASGQTQAFSPPALLLHGLSDF